MPIQNSRHPHCSGPAERLDTNERRPLLDTMRAPPQPRIEIDEALRNGWFEMWYQPKIDLKRKCLAGAEALARIRHPRFGCIAAGQLPPRGHRGQRISGSPSMR